MPSFVRALIVGIIAIILFRQYLSRWFNQSLYKHFGLSPVHEFGFSYRRGRDTPAIITLYNLKICRDHISETPGQASVMDRIPLLQEIITRLVSGSALRVEHLVLEKDDVTMTFNRVIIRPVRNPDLTIRVKSGPIQLTKLNAATGNITTDSFATFSFKSKKLDGMEVQIGKAIYDKPESVDLFAANAGRWIKNSDIARVTVDSIGFQGNSS